MTKNCKIDSIDNNDCYENDSIFYNKIFSMNSMTSMTQSNVNKKSNNSESSNTNRNTNTNTNNTKEFILPKNKGFMLLHEEFIQNGWIMNINEKNRLVYTKKENNCDEFIILINKKNNINVTIPVANSNIAYTTTFNSYFCACEFITMHIKNYELSLITTNN